MNRIMKINVLHAMRLIRSAAADIRLTIQCVGNRIMGECECKIWYDLNFIGSRENLTCSACLPFFNIN